MSYQQIWEDHWKESCTHPDGSLNLDQIQRELSDYWQVMGEVSKVYDTLTGGRISKPNTMASAVISEVQRLQQEELEELEKELTQEDEPVAGGMVAVRSYEFQYGLLHLELSEVSHLTREDIIEEYGAGKGKLLEVRDGQMSARQLAALPDFRDQ